jgi:CheY-like chemotaxis protein
MVKELHILVVEDNKINQVVTKKIIERKSYICSIVESGYEALNLLTTESFDLILMDINMPNMADMKLLNGSVQQELKRQSSL